MSRSKSPVVFTNEVGKIFAEGGSVVVECIESVSRKGSATIGQWTYEIVSADRQFRQVLNLRVKNTREVTQTTAGLITKQTGWGFATVAFPTQKGHAIEIFNDGSIVPVRRSDT